MKSVFRAAAYHFWGDRGGGVSVSYHCSRMMKLEMSLILTRGMMAGERIE